MTRLIISIGLAAVMAVTVAPAALADSYRPSTGVDIGLFFDELAPFGEWLNHPDYGWVWSPHVESADWRPYTLGRWVWTDEYGWLWSSDEEFGWAVYHYGRWIDDEEMGWVWIPGTEWGPAWVAWRDNDDYIGWAPLPPRAGWDEDDGFRSVEDFDTYIPEEQYSFVRVRLFYEPSVYNYILPRSRAVSCYRVTRNCTDYRPYRGRVVNRSVDVEHLSRITGHAVPRARAVDVPTVSAMSHGFVRNDEVTVFRPRVAPRPDLAPRTVLRSDEGRAMRTRPWGQANDAAAQRDAQALERQRTLDQQRAVDQQRVQQKQQEWQPAAERQRSAERRQQIETQNQERERAEADQRRATERQEWVFRKGQSQPEPQAHALPHEERRGPSESSGRSNGSSSGNSGSSSSSSSSSSTSWGGAGHASHGTANSGGASSSSSSSSNNGKSSGNGHASSSQSNDKDKDREYAKRRENSAAGH